jgi:hypothetical protein
LNDTVIENQEAREEMKRKIKRGVGWMKMRIWTSTALVKQTAVNTCNTRKGLKLIAPPAARGPGETDPQGGEIINIMKK